MSKWVKQAWEVFDEEQMGRRRAGIAAATVFGRCAALSVAAPAEAASCYGNYCSGNDLQAVRCSSNAYGFASVRISGTYSCVDLR